ncbi:hypothetical protein [Bradyrhizobium sp. sGM-13]|uniref:hypothetical protein n=1 Tax=Bradyrhizobium sp. sGM-13 TaxID=2831781 RepID=UPI001BCFCEE9|nr:hypothetical protein [Bradyrhizobium sp. sGM-13]
MEDKQLDDLDFFHDLVEGPSASLDDSGQFVPRSFAAIVPDFNRFPLANDEFGFAIEENEFRWLARLFEIFYRGVPDQHRLCRLVVSQDAIRIDGDNMGAFLRLNLQGKPLNFTGPKQRTYVLSYDELARASKAVKGIASIKIGTTAHLYSERFRRPLTLVSQTKFVGRCDKFANDLDLAISSEFNARTTSKALEMLGQVLGDAIPDGLSTLITLSPGLVRGGGSCAMLEAASATLPNLSTSIRLNASITLSLVLLHMGQTRIAKSGPFCIISDDRLAYGFETIAEEAPTWHVAPSTETLLLPKSELIDFVKITESAFMENAHITFTIDGDGKRECILLGSPGVDDDPHEIHKKTTGFCTRNQGVRFKLPTRPLRFLLDAVDPTNVEFAIHKAGSFIGLQFENDDLTFSAYLLAASKPTLSSKAVGSA